MKHYKDSLCLWFWFHLKTYWKWINGRLCVFDRPFHHLTTAAKRPWLSISDAKNKKSKLAKVTMLENCFGCLIIFSCSWPPIWSTICQCPPLQRHRMHPHYYITLGNGWTLLGSELFIPLPIPIGSSSALLLDVKTKKKTRIECFSL